MDESFEIEDVGEGPSTFLAEVHSNTSFARRSLSRNRAKKGGAPGANASGNIDSDEPLSADNGVAASAPKSVRRIKSSAGTIHDSDQSNLEYADFLASEQASTIKTLEANKKDLLSQLGMKDKTIAQLKKVESINSTLSLEVVALKKMVESLKAEVNDSQEKLKLAKLEQQKDVAARAALVMEDTKKSILIKRLQDDLEKANQSFQAVVDQIVNEKESANGDSKRTKADLEHVISKLRDENKSLLAENQSLKEENERNEHSIKQILLQTTVPDPNTSTASDIIPPASNSPNDVNQPSPIVASNSSTRDLGTSTLNRTSTRIPPRSSSAISLINVLPTDGNLEIQMLKQRAIAAQQIELQRLKEENQALISQLAATLNSINQNLQ